MRELRRSSLGRAYDPGQLDPATVAATTADGACAGCGRERLHTLCGQSTYDACTRVAAAGETCRLYYSGVAIRESGIGHPRDAETDEKLRALEIVPAGEAAGEAGEEYAAGPFGCEGEALAWAEDLEKGHPELRWSSIGFAK